VVPEILEGTLNPRVAPRRVVLGHSRHKLPDLGKDTATAGSLPPIRPLARHQLPVPSQERIRRDECRHLTQGFSTQPAGPHGESSSVVVRQPQLSPTELPAQDAILFKGENDAAQSLQHPRPVRTQRT